MILSKLKARLITDNRIGNQPIPCLDGGGISCGTWIYCHKEYGHEGYHEGWADYGVNQGHVDVAAGDPEATLAKWGQGEGIE